MHSVTTDYWQDPEALAAFLARAAALAVELSRQATKNLKFTDSRSGFLKVVRMATAFGGDSYGQWLFCVDL